MDTSEIYEYPVKEFFKQPRSLFGAGAYEMAGPEAAAMGLRHVLLVTSGLEGTGIIDDCKANLENAGISVTVYDKVESNPKDYNVMDTHQMFTEAECDGFVSVGGGSSHDTTKGARIVAAHDGRNINEFQGLNQSEKLENPPHIAINTTNGTGSETTPAYVITDLSSEERPHKWVAFDRACTTSLAINARVRGLHGLRYAGPCCGGLCRARPAPLLYSASLEGHRDDAIEPARGDIQHQQL